MGHVGNAKTYRDPVHDTIDWKQEGAAGAVVCALVDTPELQRLRFVRQLGMASLVFHGAEHSRFTHSLGVAHVARRMAHRLWPQQDELDRLSIVCAALLHDVGHAPFSHVMERVFSFHHESYSRAIVESPETGVHALLSRVDPSLPGRVSALIAGEGPRAHAAVISSQVDADRFDYLMRDAYMTGVQVGRYDLERVLLLLHADEDGLLVDLRAWEAVEGYLLARYHMYRLVYFHRTVRAFETLLERLFARARHLLLEQGDARIGLVGGALGALMRGEAVDVRAWSRLGEYRAWALIDDWREHPDRVLSELASGLLDRRPLVWRERAVETPEAAAREDVLAERVLSELTPQERFLFAVDEARHSPYTPYVARSTAGAGGGVRLIDGTGRITLIEHKSPVVRALGDVALRLRRWFVHPMILDKVRRVAGDQW